MNEVHILQNAWCIIEICDSLLHHSADRFDSLLQFEAERFLLTLIGPGEVKVDLADFDLKLRENLWSNLIYKKIPIPAKTSSESFWTSDMTSKNYVLTVILTIFRQKSGRDTTLPTPLPSVNIPISFRSQAA